MVLVRCLSPHSATVAKLSATAYIGQSREKEYVADTPEAAQSAFEAAFAPRKGTAARQ